MFILKPGVGYAANGNEKLMGPVRFRTPDRSLKTKRKKAI